MVLLCGAERLSPQQCLEVIIVGIVDGNVDFIVGRIVACGVEQEESLILHGFGLITSLE